VGWREHIYHTYPTERTRISNYLCPWILTYIFVLNRKKLDHVLSFFFWSGSLVARTHLIRWISGVSGVRTPDPAYNNALSYQLSYVHGTPCPKILCQRWITMSFKTNYKNKKKIMSCGNQILPPFLFIKCLYIANLTFLFNCRFCILRAWYVNYTFCQLLLSFQ